ncbi:unnamed protein product [Rotaria sp. Silwood1]|nr:unnamed protein product [Rotaria sp. Silwood1]CAF1221080.1 unnamed protein product [Rotaria sp. Silwood1]
MNKDLNPDEDLNASDDLNDDNDEKYEESSTPVIYETQCQDQPIVRSSKLGLLEYFGSLALLFDESHKGSVMATSPMECAIMGKENI